ncbi:hypothetical protein DWX10_16140 [Clostridium sp. AF18-27]|uniref:DUF7666 domain-containing protein n=1 Tax=Enterocloster lavalensis TaxID=460384 RepID=UPI000E53D45F|nr:hypothetical protein [Enterocloster lavalensis]RHR51947.1 hypothetical protein DWX10_16140 [Clostridium sp. AF18-27]
MIAYKGFDADLQARWGSGTYRYEAGKTYKEDRSKCASSGFHCAENPIDCLKWYPLGAGNRYFLVEASGSLDETTGDSKIACTQITLLKELTTKRLAGHAMIYMVKHPLREWERIETQLKICKDKADAPAAGHVAIARGEAPMVRGAEGAILGLIREVGGIIEDAKLFEVTGDVKPYTWYTLENRTPKEVQDET